MRIGTFEETLKSKYVGFFWVAVLGASSYVEFMEGRYLLAVSGAFILGSWVGFTFLNIVMGRYRESLKAIYQDAFEEVGDDFLTKITIVQNENIHNKFLVAQLKIDIDKQQEIIDSWKREL